MRDKDFYWLAGILEGEGSFMKGPPSSSNQVRISVQMKDWDVIDRVRKLFEVEYIQETIPENPNWNVTYRVQIKGKKAEKLMRELQPYMGMRRYTQIQTALDSIVPNAKSVARRKASPYSEAQIAEVKIQLTAGKKHALIAEEVNIPQHVVKGISAGRIYQN